MSERKLIIHDLPDEVFLQWLTKLEGWQVFDAKTKTAPCKACQACWMKTPGICVLKDKLQTIGSEIAQSDELVLISRCCYGGYSPEVKRVLDRSISGHADEKLDCVMPVML